MPLKCQARILLFLFLFLVFEIGSHDTAKSAHELLILLLYLLSTGMTGVYHHTWLRRTYFFQSWEEEPCKVSGGGWHRPSLPKMLTSGLPSGLSQMVKELRLIFSEESSTYKAALFNWQGAGSSPQGL